MIVYETEKKEKPHYRIDTKKKIIYLINTQSEEIKQEARKTLENSIEKTNEKIL